jgi:hypothetical protein
MEPEKKDKFFTLLIFAVAVIAMTGLWVLGFAYP